MPARKRNTLRVAVLLIAMHMFMALAAFAIDRGLVMHRRSVLREGPLESQLAVLDSLAAQPDPAFAETLLELVDNSDNPRVIAAAGWAGRWMLDAAGSPVDVDEASEDVSELRTAARVLAVARLSDNTSQVNDWLAHGKAAIPSSVRAAGLLSLWERGHFELTGDVVQAIAKLSDESRYFLLHEFQRTAEPLLHVVGQKADWTALVNTNSNAAAWSDLQYDLTGVVSSKVLTDLIHRWKDPDPRWVEVNRLVALMPEFARKPSTLSEDESIRSPLPPANLPE